MKDFYSRKLEAFKTCENLIKQITQSGSKAKHAELLRECRRVTGFSLALERYLKDLIADGIVKQSYNEQGESMLEWVF